MTKNINGFDQNGQTALVSACQRGCTETVKLLLKYGANPSASNRHGQIPYDVASEAIKNLLDDALTRQNVFRNNR